MVFDDVFEHIPDGVVEAFDHAFCALDVVRGAVFEEFAHDEWLEEFNSHFFGRPHWCILSSGPTTITERPE